MELNGLDSYLYLRAYTGSLQEYTEATLFYHYTVHERIPNWNDIKSLFVYETDDGETVELLYPHVEYVLGLADFTGELMRKCINGLGHGNVEQCFKLCNYVKDILIGYLSKIVSFLNSSSFLKVAF